MKFPSMLEGESLTRLLQGEPQRTKAMLKPAVFKPDSPAFGLAYTRIRDRILINKALKLKLEGLPGGITLVAREIKHDDSIDLILPGRSIVIIADRYDAKGQKIDVSGQKGSPGAAGRNGTQGFASHTARIPGGSGALGFSGTDGANGGSIQIVTQRLGNVRLIANGGVGGRGGDGGAGGNGGAGLNQRPKFEGFDGSLGGSGGAAGNGGNGGKGGRIDVEFTAAGVPPPLSMEVEGGAAGQAGRGGKGGASGRPSDGPAHGSPGAGGRPGTHGAAGSSRIEPIGSRNYWKHASERLNSTRTASWAAYRYLVGVYFYRQFKPNSQLLQDRLRLATTEFEAVLSLMPGHAEASRCNRQIELGQNVLGLPFNLDLDPRFDEYLPRYASFSTFIESIYSQGLNLLLAGESQSLALLQIALDIGRINTEIAFATIDLSAAQAGAKAAKDTVADVTARLDLLAERIKVASQKRPDDSISIGTILATVGTVAAAVGSVIAAVPTAGASLYALVPSLAGLAVQLNTIGGHIFEATTAEKDALKAKYKEAGKNVDNVVQGVKSVINLAQAIKQLTDSKNASNSELIDLMRQGVQLSHELLIAKLKSEQADLTEQARAVQVDGSKQLANLAADQKRRLENGEPVFIEAGRAAIRATQRKIDSILTVSFQAERSLEIYTFTDQSGIVSFDTGFIHPDIEADFDEKDVLTPQLVAAYSTSFLPILDPLNLQNSFDSYFNSDPQFEFVGQVNVYSIKDQESLNSFKESHNGERSINFLVDLPDLPKHQLEMKIEQANVALVGATSRRPALDCKVKHGGVYLSRGRHGDEITQTLSEHIIQTNPQFVSFQDQTPPPSAGIQGHDRARTDHLWGRGLGGRWLLAIADEEFQSNGVDLAGLTEVQLWVETQAFVKK
jgi:hypothetical protein